MTYDTIFKEWHGVEISSSIPEHIIEWLDTKVGKDHWFQKGTIGGNMIYFDKERDHFLFLMTWGK